MGRQAANTKLSTHVAVRKVRVRGGNEKFRALRLDSGNFAWGTEVCCVWVCLLLLPPALASPPPPAAPSCASACISGGGQQQPVQQQQRESQPTTQTHSLTASLPSPHAHTQAVARKTRIMDVVYNASNNELVRTQTLVKNAIVQVDATPFKAWYQQHYGYELGLKGKEEPKKVDDMKVGRQGGGRGGCGSVGSVCKLDASRQHTLPHSASQSVLRAWQSSVWITASRSASTCTQQHTFTTHARAHNTNTNTTQHTQASSHVKRKLKQRLQTRKIDPLVAEQFTTGRLYACIASRPGQCGRCDGYILEGGCCC